MATEESSIGNVPPVRQGEDRRGELSPVHSKGEAVKASGSGSVAYAALKNDMWASGWKRPKGKCQKCGKMFALSAPTGYWTDALYPRKHRLPNGEICEGVWYETEIVEDERKILNT